MFRGFASSDRLCQSVATGICWELVRRCRTRSGGESPVARRRRDDVHGGWRPLHCVQACYIDDDSTLRRDKNKAMSFSGFTVVPFLDVIGVTVPIVAEKLMSILSTNNSINSGKVIYLHRSTSLSSPLTSDARKMDSERRRLPIT
jgi:hypothetical protein